MLGPFSAPSSPPLIPMPMKWMDFFAQDVWRRSVSLYRLLPPSITISSLSKRGRRSFKTMSTGSPAFTIKIILRDFSRRLTSSFKVFAPAKNSPPCSWINSAVFSVVRLKTRV